MDQIAGCDKTPGHVYGFLLFLASLCVVFVVIAYGTRHWSRTISPSGDPAGSEAPVSPGFGVAICLLAISPGYSRSFDGFLAEYAWRVDLAHH